VKGGGKDEEDSDSKLSSNGDVGIIE